MASSALLVSLLLFAGTTISCLACDQCPFTSDRHSLYVDEIGGTVFTPDFSSFVEALLDEWPRAPGVAVGVVHSDGFVETRGWGNSTEDGDGIDENTRFSIGSMSKAIAATSLGILIEELQNSSNPITWNSKLTDLLPNTWRLQDEWASEKANLIDILSHRSGLPRHDLSYRQDDTPEECIKRMRFLKPSFELREHYHYNNQMYGLPGYLIGAYGNQSYVSFAKERIFDPIGMASSTFWPSVASASKNLTQTWTGNGRQIPYWITDSQAEFISGAGGVISTAKDMTKWIKVLLSQGIDPETGKRIIPLSTIDITTRAHTVAIPKARFPELSIEVYGMGWVRTSYQGHELVWHTGGVPGGSTIIAFLPNDGIGVTALVNADSKDVLVFPLVLRIVEHLLGLEQIDWVSRFKRMASSEKHETNVNSSTNESTYAGIPATSYVGTYTNAGYPGNLALCAPQSTSTYCKSVIHDFSYVYPDIHDTSNAQLYAYWPRFWSSHVRLTPSSYTQNNTNNRQYNIYFVKLFTHGYGRDTSAFEQTTAAPGKVEFEMSENGETVLGFGYDDPVEGLDRGTIKGDSVKERSDVWFERID